jgi:hypothetical protein
MEDWRRRVDSDIAVLKSSISAIKDWEQEDRRLHQVASDFIVSFRATQQAMREEQNRKHHANSTKLNLILAISAIVGVIVSIGAIYVSVRIANHQSVLNLKTANPPYVAEYHASEE